MGFTWLLPLSALLVIFINIITIIILCKEYILKKDR